MDEYSMQDALAFLLEDQDESNEHFSGDNAIMSVDTFTDAGILTLNKGLVVRMADGAEFHITIVRG